MRRGQSITKIRNEGRKVTTKLTKIKSIMRQHYEHLYTKKLGRLDEGDKFLEKCKLLKLTLEESKNKCIKTKEIDFII